MADRKLPAVVQYVRRLAKASSDDSVTDQELLASFVAERDETAFAAVVERHGRLVWGVCRRALGNTPDAEDVFQATFLVLIRKANVVRWQASVAGWLFEVASRLAKETKRNDARRRFHERRALASAPSTSPSGSIEKLAMLLDSELRSLPGKYRDPCLLCYVEGRTADQASRRLGCSLRTVERRLAQARQLLRSRLLRQGVTFSAALVAGGLANGEAASARLCGSTVRAAAVFATGRPAPSTPAVVLAEAFMKGLAMTRLTWVGLIIVATTIAAGTGTVMQFASAGPKQDAREITSAQGQNTTGAAAGEPDAAKSGVDAMAQRAWKIMELVAQRHIDGVHKDALILGGLTSVKRVAGEEPPTDETKRQIANISTGEDFAAFLRANWPKTIAKSPPSKKPEKSEGMEEERDGVLFFADDHAPRDPLQDAFLAGLLRSVPGTARLVPPPDPKEARVAEQISANRYVGIGIQLAMTKEKQPQIQVAMPGGAARQGGIRAGDIIEEVEGKVTQNRPLKEIVDWLRGDEGTTVHVKVRQPDSKESRTYALKRAKVPFQHVFGYRRASQDGWSYHVEPDLPIAYLKVESPVSSTLHELRQAERKLRAEGFQAVVIDLRGNSGGLLNHTALVADGLLDGGVMWRIQGAGTSPPTEYRADRECLFRDWPMVVLVDGRMGMSDALIAAALQDNKRAILVGEPTKVMGYVLTSVQLPDEPSSLVVPTARFERSVKAHGWPVKPDVLVPMDAAHVKALAEWRRKMASADGPTAETKQAPADTQLAKAIEILRGQLSAGHAPARLGSP
jgi:C-terminal peptidase prc